MNSFAVRLALVLVLTLPGTHSIAQDADAELQSLRQTVSEMFPEIRPEHVFAGPLDGWYTIRKGAIVAYISADGRYLMQGDLIDLDGQVNLTETARNSARRDMMANVPDGEAIIFSPDEVKHRVDIFTDVDCTFCRRLHAQIDDYLGKGIEIRYLLYPRNGPTSESWATSERVWCADDRAEALTLAKLDQAFESKSCDTPMISKHYAMGQDVGLRGTPAIVLEDGTIVSGYLPADQLFEALEESTP